MAPDQFLNKLETDEDGIHREIMPLSLSTRHIPEWDGLKPGTPVRYAGARWTVVKETATYVVINHWKVGTKNVPRRDLELLE